MKKDKKITELELNNIQGGGGGVDADWIENTCAIRMSRS
jgi:bacteriocin-like protein